MTAYREYRLQLKSAKTLESIISAGGYVHVAQAGLPDKQTIYADANGGALASVFQPTRGFINFFTLDSVASVDLYILSPGGHFVELSGVVPGGPNEILVDTFRRRGVLKLPFSITDSVAATEQDTGFDLPAQCFVLNRLHGFGLLVTVLDATHTIDVGLGEVHPAESGGDANGWIAASSVGALGLVTGTDGALFSTNAPHKSDVVTAKSITYTLNAGTTLAKGFILIPYSLVG